MFKRNYNRAILHIRIETVTPLRIPVGDVRPTRAAAGLARIRTHHGTTVYIPGTSLKGVLRAAAEAAVRGRRYNGIDGTCNSFDHATNCSKKAQKTMGETNEKFPLDVVHEQQCLVCRVFGTASMIGRIGISNFFPWNDSDGICAEFQPGGQNQVRANRVEVCHLVAIDRETWSVIGPFAQEVVPAGISFFGSIALSNYQAWQLGLIAQAIAAVDDGFAQLGSCKSRGFGVAKLSVESILHEQDAVDKTSPVGVGRLIGPQESKDYALLPDSVLTNLVGVIDGLRRRFLVRDEQAIRAWLDSGLSSFGML